MQMKYDQRARRLCFVVTNDVSTVFFRGYLAYLRARGWLVTVVAQDSGRLDLLAVAEGVEVLAVPMAREPSPARDIASLVRMFGVIRKVRPDILIYSTPKAALLASLAGWGLRVPVRIYSIWGLRYETAQGIRRRVLVALERLTVCCSTSVAAVSPSLAEELRARRIAPRAIVVGAGSTAGVDIVRFAVDAPDIPTLDAKTASFLRAFEGQFVLSFVGRISPDKGVHTLLAALRLLADRGFLVPVVVVGAEEDSAAVTALRAAAESTPIHFVGSVQDPRPYFAVSGALCLPSYREGFGQVVVEAASMAIPAIVSDATGVRDVVVPEVTGIRVPVRDASALADAIQRLASDEELRRALGQQARARTLKLYASRTVWDAYDDFFRSSLKHGDQSSEGADG